MKQFVEGSSVQQKASEPQQDPQTPHERDSAFRKDLEHAINKNSRENGSNTPDFILGAYLTDCLEAFDRAFRWREKWYSPEGVPVDERHNGPARHNPNPSPPAFVQGIGGKP